MFSFRPITETDEQLEQMKFRLLDEGWYDFVVKDLKNTTSQKTNKPMLKLVITVWDRNGREVMLFDNFMDEDWMRHKIKNFCIATDQIDSVTNGKLGENCINKNGKVLIGIKKSSDPKYGPQNFVKDYARSDDKKASTEFVDDYLPF